MNDTLKLEHGFTLIEVLVAIALSMIVILIVLNIMTSTNRLTQNSVNQASRLDDLQGISAIIGDDVRAARAALDNLSVPTWVPVAGGVKALTVRYPLTATCNVNNEVAYVVYTRTALTGVGVNAWLRLPMDDANSTRQALVRVEHCNSTVSSRLVADYLESFTFKLAQLGETTFRDSGLAANAGIPFRSVEFRYAASRDVGGQIQRVPRTGTLRTVATARAP